MKSSFIKLSLALGIAIGCVAPVVAEVVSFRNVYSVSQASRDAAILVVTQNAAFSQGVNSLAQAQPHEIGPRLESLGQIYTADVNFFGPGLPGFISGRQAVLQYFSGLLGQGVRGVELITETVELRSDGTTREVGTIILTQHFPSGQVARVPGRYYVLRNVHGQIYHDELHLNV